MQILAAGAQNHLVHRVKIERWLCLVGYRNKIQAKFQSLILQCIVSIVTSVNGCKAFFKILNLPGLDHKKRCLNVLSGFPSAAN